MARSSIDRRKSYTVLFIRSYLARVVISSGDIFSHCSCVSGWQIRPSLHLVAMENCTRSLGDLIFDHANLDLLIVKIE